MPAFKRAVSDAIDIHAGARVRVDVQLELGPVTEIISVPSRAALLNTDTSSLTHEGAREIAEGIYHATRAFAAGERQRDDVTSVIMKVTEAT